MQITRLTNAAEFYQCAERYLLEREAEHSVILGTCTSLIRHPETIREQPYFVVVEDDGRIISAAMLTPPHNLDLAHTIYPGALKLIIDDLLQAGIDLPGVVGAKDISRVFADLWQKETGCEYQATLSMRAYQLVAVTPVTNIPGQMRRASESDRDLLAEWIIAFHNDAHLHGPPPDTNRMLDLYLAPGVEDVRGYYVWEVNGQPASLAGYTGPTLNGIRINSVYTPPDQRRRGYASALVAELSQYMLDSGRRFCFLFTDLSNPTSNRIYQDIGYRPVCDVDQYIFE